MKPIRVVSPVPTASPMGAAFRRPKPAAALIFVCALALQHCASTPAATPPATLATPDATALTPVLSVKELMEHIVDPTAD